MFEIEPGGRIPIYEQVVNAMARHIIYGVIAPGEQLPSVRGLAAELGINPNTVQKAYQYLEENRLIFSVKGKGSFAAEKPELPEDMLLQIRKKLEHSIYDAVRMGYPREKMQELVDTIYENTANHKKED